MPSLAIVEDFNIVEKVRRGFGPGTIDVPVHPLAFERGKETLGYGII